MAVCQALGHEMADWWAEGRGPLDIEVPTGDNATSVYSDELLAWEENNAYLSSVVVVSHTSFAHHRPRIPIGLQWIRPTCVIAATSEPSQPGNSSRQC